MLLYENIPEGPKEIEVVRWSVGQKNCLGKISLKSACEFMDEENGS